MRARIVLWVACVACATAHAQVLPQPFTDLRVLPSPATSTDVVYATVLDDACTSVIPGTQQITRSGNSVRWTLTVIGAVCFPGLLPNLYEANLGTFVPGRYSLVLVAREFNGNEFQTLTTTFQVMPASVPIASKPAWWALALGVAALGFWRVRARSIVR